MNPTECLINIKAPASPTPQGRVEQRGTAGELEE